MPKLALARRVPLSLERPEVRLLPPSLEERQLFVAASDGRLLPGAAAAGGAPPPLLERLALPNSRLVKLFCGCSWSAPQCVSVKVRGAAPAGSPVCQNLRAAAVWLLLPLLAVLAPDEMLLPGSWKNLKRPCLTASACKSSAAAAVLACCWPDAHHMSFLVVSRVICSKFSSENWLWLNASWQWAKCDNVTYKQLQAGYDPGISK